MTPKLDPFEQPHAYAVRRAREPIDAVVRVPGSKSIANRALICATLAAGESVLRNVPSGDDTAAMIDCVALLGAGVLLDAGHGADAGPTAVMQGTGGALRPGPMTLQTRLAGTTSRFLTAVCALGMGEYVIDGLPPLRERPMAPLHDALLALGAGVSAVGQPGHLPVAVTGVDRERVSDRRTVSIRGDISSQYITALMLIAPYLPGGLHIQVTTTLVSRPYVAITSAVMADFGCTEVRVDESSIVIGPGEYRSCEYSVEADASSASYPLAAAAICGGTVRVPGLGRGALQGDAAFADILATMGCLVERTDDDVTVTRAGPLRGVTVDMSDLSDLVPTLAVVAPFASSPTEITGVGFIRAKESDRLGDLARELRTCGIRASELDDGIRIEPGVGVGGDVDTHHDHRLAMAFGVLGLGVDGVVVNDPGVVSKSWPDFWDLLDSIADRTPRDVA